MLKQGDKKDVYINSYIGDGRGISIMGDKLFLVDGITSDDENVKIKISNVYETLVKGKKIGDGRGITNYDDDKDDVYETDEDVYEEEDDDDEEDYEE